MKLYRGSKQLLVFGFVLLCFIILGLKTKDSNLKVQSDPLLPPYLQVDSLWVDSVLNSLSTKDKIAQLIMYPVYTNKDAKHISEIESYVQNFNIGGVIFMQGGPERQINAYNKLQAVSKVPLLTSIDGEWGISMRLDSVIKFPRQLMLGAIQHDSLIYEMGKEVAKQCKLTGVHVNFSPDIDVNVNPKNPVINSRSFGEDPKNVANKGIAYMKGMQDKNVLACAKHFPGHGDTDTDSHKALPLINHSRSRIDSVELYPFQKLIDAGVGSIMIAHLYVPSLDNTVNRATTLSPKVVTKMLKDSMHFKGITFTDALNMNGVSKYYKPGEVDLLAFKAGNDVLLFSQDIPKAIESIYSSIQKGEISIKELNSRVRKILMLKKWLGLDKQKLINNINVVSKINSDSADLINRRLVQSALTLLNNTDSVIPLRGLDKLKVSSLDFGTPYHSYFQKSLEKYSNVKHYNLLNNASRSMLNSIIDKLDSNEQLIIGVHGTSFYPYNNYGISSTTIAMVEELIENHKNVIVALFANPYVMNSFSNLHKAKAVVVAYEDNKLTQEYTSQLIFGGIKAKGKLPVSVNSNFKAGMGVFTTVTRLKYGNPLEENMNPQILSKIDSLAQNGINEKAYPGCQVLVARNGNIVYQKSFGYHTYEKKNPVLNEDLYDLASITKVAASVPALMKLVDDKKINLDYSLCDYLDYVKDTEYENINIRRMLAHTAGLVSWIPFYNKTLSRGQLKLDVYNSSFSEEYKTKVADNLFIKPSFKDSIRYWITNHGIHKKKEYRYSDLGYYFYKDIIEKQFSKPMDVVLDSFLYKPLGAISLTYNPLKRFDKNEIIPTENDMIFRKRLIHGYVHDPGAAMIGGVAGHAGLFSNANDLAKLFQMYLNWGVYGSQKFVTKEVIEEFIKCQYCKEDNRRGAGFDKPSTTEAGPTCTCVSYASFGHTGFTGTMVWADPDEDIIYIFLSNRVYPDAENKKLVRMNIRTDIQSVIYESIIK